MKIAFVVLLAISTAFSLTLKVGIYDDYPMCYLEDGKPKGFYVDILNEIAKENGWKIEYVYDDWTSLLSKLESGEIDALAAIAHTPEREKRFDFNEEPFVTNWGVVISNEPVSTFIDLDGKKVGLVRNDVYAEEFEKLAKKFDVDAFYTYYETYSQVAKDVESGKIDAGVVSRFFAFVNSNRYSYYTTPIIFKPVMLKMAFHKGSPLNLKVVPVIDMSLKKMKKDKNSIYWKAIEEYLSGKVPKIRLKEYVKYLYIFILIVVFIAIWLEFLVKKKTEELRVANENLRAANEELRKLNEETKRMNEELKDSFERFKKVIELSSKVGTLEKSEEEFAKEILKLALKLVPKAKYGSVSIFEGDRWIFLASVGHDIDKLKNLDLKKEYSVAWGIDKTQVIDRIQDSNVLMMPEDVAKALKEAAKPVKSTILAPLEVEDEIKGYLALDIPDYSDEEFDESDIEIVDKFSKLMAGFYMAKKYASAEGKLKENVALALMKALEQYDPYRKGHSEGVRDLSLKLARRYGLGFKRLKILSWAALIHDVGMIFIPQRILNKPGKLTKEEYDIVKTHTTRAYSILSEIEGMEEIANVVLHHHERWDGKGYPEGLKETEIPLESRIIAIADSFNAMMNERSYRRALSFDESIEEIRKNSGKQFDPTLVEIFLRMMEDVKEAI